MSKTVSVLDYGASNLHNVARAVQASGCSVDVVSDPGELTNANRLILPGVGAFGHGMTNLRESGFKGPLLAFIESGKPLLGICLGMQMLFDGSEECPSEQGLGVLPGMVTTIPRSGQPVRRKTPHIGWTGLHRPDDVSWSSTPLQGITTDDSVYFVHSFAAVADNTDHQIAVSEHAGFRFTSFVQIENVFGCQFHPEKSGPVGLEIIRRFIQL